MIWLLIVPLVVFWAILMDRYLTATGNWPQSRRSLRRQRKKARDLGVDPADVPYSAEQSPIYDYLETKAKLARWNPFFIGATVVLLVLIFWRP
jgi:hypothetical protein